MVTGIESFKEWFKGTYVYWNHKDNADCRMVTLRYL